MAVRARARVLGGSGARAWGVWYPTPPLEDVEKSTLCMLCFGNVYFWSIARKKNVVSVTKIVLLPSQNAIFGLFAQWEPARQCKKVTLFTRKRKILRSLSPGLPKKVALCFPGGFAVTMASDIRVLRARSHQNAAFRISPWRKTTCFFRHPQGGVGTREWGGCS